MNNLAHPSILAEQVFLTEHVLAPLLSDVDLLICSFYQGLLDDMCLKAVCVAQLGFFSSFEKLV